MAPPSKLAIATSSLSRLIKEEASYHREEKQQLDRITSLEQNPTAGDENADFYLKQERKALEETRAVFPLMRQRIVDATAQLEQRLESDGGTSASEDVDKAKQAIQNAGSVTK